MEKLVALLLKYGVEISAFGKGEAKTLDHLLTEVEGGEWKVPQISDTFSKTLFS
jgi:hypothetical protein